MAAKWLAETARKTFQPTEVEGKLQEALSKKNYGAPKSMLNDIARYTFDYSQYSVVMEAMWKAINEKGKNWRVVFKGLVLMDHLIKIGAERVVDECRERIYTIRTLTEFQYIEEKKDKGAGVRQQAKSVVALLNDTDMIRTERAKARKLRDRFVGISNDGQQRGGSSSSGGGRRSGGSGGSGGRGGSGGSSSGGGGGGRSGGFDNSDSYNSRGADGGYSSGGIGSSGTKKKKKANGRYDDSAKKTTPKKKKSSKEGVAEEEEEGKKNQTRSRHQAVVPTLPVIAIHLQTTRRKRQRSSEAVVPKVIR